METMYFVPLTIVFLCSYHTWSYHKTSISHLCGPSSCSPGTWHGLDLHCNSASSVFLQTTHQSDLWSTSTTKMTFGFEATEKKPCCMGCLPSGLLSVGSYLNGAQLENALPAAVRGSTELWNNPISIETLLQQGKTYLRHLPRFLTCSTKSPVWIWEDESTVCPTIYSNPAQRLV